MLFWLSAIVLLAATLLGGATRTGYIGDVVVQLLAIALLLASAWGWMDQRTASSSLADASATPETRDNYHLFIPVLIFLGVIAVLAIQLIPFPAELRSMLGANPAGAANGLPTHDPQTGWQTISLTPHATWAYAASLLVPLAVFSAVAQLNESSRLRLCGLILVLGALALVLGLLQVAQGPHSELRFFDITNRTEAVGFFANRNHFAAQLYVTLLLAAVWFATMTRASLESGTALNRTVLWFIAAAVFLIAIVSGLAMARSRAGIILAMVAIFGIVAMFAASRAEAAKPEQQRPAKTFGQGRIALLTLGFAVIFAAQFGLHRLQTRFTHDPLAGQRVQFSTTTLETAIASLPFGTGFGSFVPVYATVEKNADVFSSYANRAHNDFAEFFLEAGIPGLILIALFLVWFVPRTAHIWSRHDGTTTGTTHRQLQRAATLAVALLLAHSFVDYPLRTTAMAALFAFSCATLVPPRRSPAHASSSNGSHDGDVRQHNTRPPDTPRPQPPPRIARKRWGSDVEWPTQWQNKTQPKRDADDE